MTQTGSPCCATPLRDTQPCPGCAQAAVGDGGGEGGMRVTPSPSLPGTAVRAGGCASSASRQRGWDVAQPPDSHCSGLVTVFFWVAIMQTCQEQQHCWELCCPSPVSFQPVTWLYVEWQPASRKEKDFSP